MRLELENENVVRREGNLNNASGVAKAVTGDIVSKYQMFTRRRHSISLVDPHSRTQLIKKQKFYLFCLSLSLSLPVIK